MSESQGDITRRAIVLTLCDWTAKVCSLAAALLAARWCGVVGFGELSFAQALSGFVVVVATCGTEAYAVKVASVDPTLIRRLIPTIVMLRLCAATLSFAGAALVVILVPSLAPVAPLFLLFSLAAFTGALSLQWVSQAQRSTHVMGAANVVAQAVYLGLVIHLAPSADALWPVPVSLVTGELLAVLGIAIWAWRQVGTFGTPLPLSDALAFLRRALPLGGSQLLRAIALGSDLVIVGLLLPMSDTGVYSAAYRFFALGLTAASLYIIVALPQIVESAHTTPEMLRGHLRTSIRIVLAVSVPAVAVSAGVAPLAIAFLFGEDFVNGAGPMRLLLVALLISAVAGHYRAALLALESQMRDTEAVAWSTAAHIGFKLAFGALWGVEGVASGTIIGELLLLILVRRAFLSDRRVTTIKDDFHP